MADPHERPPFLVLGLGNPLLSDDGVGLELLRALESELAGDSRFELVDGGTLGVALVGLFEGRRGVLLLATRGQRDAPPGTIHVCDALQAAGAPAPQLRRTSRAERGRPASRSCA